MPRSLKLKTAHDVVYGASTQSCTEDSFFWVTERTQERPLGNYKRVSFPQPETTGDEFVCTSVPPRRRRQRSTGCNAVFCIN